MTLMKKINKKEPVDAPVYDNLEDDFVLLANEGKLPLEVVNNDEQILVKIQKEPSYKYITKEEKEFIEKRFAKIEENQAKSKSKQNGLTANYEDEEEYEDYEYNEDDDEEELVEDNENEEEKEEEEYIQANENLKIEHMGKKTKQNKKKNHLEDEDIYTYDELNKLIFRR